MHSGAVPGENYREAGRDIEEGIEMARLLEKVGFDSLHIDAGCYDSWYWAHPPVYQEHGCMLDMAARVKNAVHIPVVAVGKLDIPELAEKALIDSKADMIAIGRGLLADSDWALKASSGKSNEIRPCIGCHDGCIGRFFRGKPLSCAVNPACGRERLYRLNTSTETIRVMVVGGGVSGMEAARVAAIIGHKVDLYEKDNNLGGHLIEASVPSFKKDLVSLLNWYRHQMRATGVNLHLDSEVSQSDILNEQPDVLIISTGSVPQVPDIPGIGNNSVVTSIDLLSGVKNAGNEVIVIGGGLVGCETALWLAQQGRKVTVIEILPELMTGSLPIPHMNRTMLIDLLSINKVSIITGAEVKEITGEGAVVEKSTCQELIKADTIVLATGFRSRDDLYKVFSGKIPRVFAIGDCRSPGNIMGAIWDGYEVGRVI